jgi:hypothetical protein
VIYIQNVWSPLQITVGGLAQPVQRCSKGWIAGIRFPTRARDFPFPQLLPRLCGSPSLQFSGYWGHFPRLKWPWPESVKSPLLSTKAKNCGTIPPLPHTRSLRGAQLIERKENFPLQQRGARRILFKYEHCAFLRNSKNITVFRPTCRPKLCKFQ